MACSTTLRLDARQGEVGAAELAHLLPIAAGGRHSQENVAWLCGACNAAQRDAVGLDAVRRIGTAACQRGRGVAVLHASVTSRAAAA